MTDKIASVFNKDFSFVVGQSGVTEITQNGYTIKVYKSGELAYEFSRVGWIIKYKAANAQG